MSEFNLRQRTSEEKDAYFALKLAELNQTNRLQKARIAELEKEIAKLKIMKSGELRDWVLRLENNVENLLEKNAELEASLKKYGRHISDGLAFEIAGHTDGACPSSVDRGECVCGFDKDLKPDQRGGE